MAQVKEHDSTVIQGTMRGRQARVEMKDRDSAALAIQAGLLGRSGRSLARDEFDKRVAPLSTRRCQASEKLVSVMLEEFMRNDLNNNGKVDTVEEFAAMVTVEWKR